MQYAQGVGVCVCGQVRAGAGRCGQVRGAGLDNETHESPGWRNEIRRGQVCGPLYSVARLAAAVAGAACAPAWRSALARCAGWPGARTPRSPERSSLSVLPGGAGGSSGLPSGIMLSASRTRKESAHTAAMAVRVGKNISRLSCKCNMVQKVILQERFAGHARQNKLGAQRGRSSWPRSSAF